MAEEALAEVMTVAMTVGASRIKALQEKVNKEAAAAPEAEKPKPPEPGCSS